jgi:hypothetical protein
MVISLNLIHETCLKPVLLPSFHFWANIIENDESNNCLKVNFLVLSELVQLESKEVIEKKLFENYNIKTREI